MAKWCKNYRAPFEHDECAVGIRYEEVRLDHEEVPYTSRGIRYTARRSLPCFPAGDSLNLKGATCEKCVFQTPEEVAAENAEHAKRFADTMKAREAIVTHLGPWKRGMKGSGGAITCPVCEKPETLRFTRSGYNGHIHAACEGCVCWME